MCGACEAASFPLDEAAYSFMTEALGRPLTETPDAPGPAPRQIGAPLDLSTPGTAPQSELPPPPANNPSGTGAMQATLPPTSSPRDAYDLAYGYVLHKDFGLAVEGFRTFLRQYPSDRLAPEAQYWLGEVLRKYPRAAASVKQSVEREQKRGHC